MKLFKKIKNAINNINGAFGSDPRYVQHFEWNPSEGGFEPTETQLEAINSGIDIAKVEQIGKNKNDISDLKENLADYRGSFASKAVLDAYTGTKNNNDYAVVLADETHDDACTRYIYVAGTTNAWVYQYTVNNSPMTQAQLDALNSGIESTKVDQIETNKNDITDLKAKKVITDVPSLPAIGNPDTLYRITTTASWKVNGSNYNISESHDLRLYKILDASQVSVSNSGITISGTNYNYGSVDSALQNSLMNALLSGYISYVMVSEDETAAINMYNNNEVAFYISYIDDELNTLYNVNTLTHTNAEVKLYQYTDHYIPIDDYRPGTGLSMNGTTINHTNSVTAQTTSKVGAITFDAQGHITGFAEKQIYLHTMGIKYTNLSNYYGTFNIFNESSSPLTHSDLATYLYSKGYNSAEKQYPISGSDDFVSRYCATTSGGSTTREFIAMGLMTGIFSDDGLTLKYLYNRISIRTLSSTPESGSWIQEINNIRIV